MYEPLILEKKKPRTHSGTLFAKVNAVIILTQIFAYCGSFFFLSKYMMTRKKFIAELNEVEITFGGLKVSNEEYQDAKIYWRIVVAEKISSIIFGTNNKVEELLESSSSAASADTQNE